MLLSRLPFIKTSQRSLKILMFMLFFWTLFDGTVSYITPLVITQHVSETQMGLIIGTASIVGAIFDFWLSKFLDNTHYRRTYLLLFALSFAFPFVLWHANSIFLFLIAMAIWGIYYDFENFGSFDFIGRKVAAEHHSVGFGFIAMFKSLGYLLAPLIAGLLIGTVIDWKPFVIMVFFLSIAFVFYILLLRLGNKEKREFMETPKTMKKLHLLLEVRIWEEVGKLIFPVLLLTMLLNIFDSVFWTIGPVFAESIKTLHPFNGLFLTMYELPPLLVGWFIGLWTRRFGKKRTAFLSFVLGGIVLSLCMYIHSPLVLLLLIFCASLFISTAWPSINGAYADYLSETPRYQKEIQALEDFFRNIGFIIGPILAGFLADRIGNAQTFSLLGIVCAFLAFLLLRITPKHIKIPEKITTG